jgi:DNA polymerase IV (DinB-like DNA polymerase)
MARGARLPGTPEDDRVVCHVDMDCFYAACERLKEPALEGQPVVVGMGYEPEDDIGAVATASYEAREYGVESAMAITEALERLPRKLDAVDDPDADPDDAGFYRPVDMEFYKSVSADVKAVLHEHADVVREVSIDEAYLDVTETTGWEDVRAFARKLRTRIEDRAGVVASVGVAPNMSAAKIASDHDKPDGMTVVEPGDVRDFLAPLDVADVHGVGPVTARQFREMGIETAGDLASADIEAVVDRFGDRGREVYRYARGEDTREVTPKGDPKSLSRESAFGQATEDHERVRERAQALATDVAERAERKDALYQTIGVKVVEPPFDINTRARSLSGPVSDPDLLESVAMDLLAEFEGCRVRKVGVRVSNLSFTEGDQASLDGFAGEGTGVESAGSLDRPTRERDPEGQASLGDFE